MVRRARGIQKVVSPIALELDGEAEHECDRADEC